MKTFDELYDELSLNELKIAEKYRKSNNFKIFLIPVAVVIVTILFILSPKILFDISELFGVGVFIIAIFVLIIGVLLISAKFFGYIYDRFSTKEEKTISYAELYKSQIITPLIKIVLPNANYAPKEGLPHEEYKYMGYPEHYDRYVADDLIDGFIDINTKDKKGRFKRLLCYTGFYKKIIYKCI